MANFTLVTLALLVSSFVASHPHKSRHEKKEEDKPVQIKMSKAVPLSQVRNTAWVGKEHGMLIFKEDHYGLPTPLMLMAAYTNKPARLTPSGSIHFTGISLSPDTLLSLHFRIAMNTSFTDPLLRFQLEDREKKSPVKNIYVDTMHLLCPIQGSKLLHKMYCTRPSSSSSYSSFSTADMLILDGIPIPVINDFDFEDGVGSLHVFLEDEAGNLLMSGRFFAKQEEEDDE